MSKKSRRKAVFLKQHPLCCFCGGKTPAEEPDHVPPRVLFDERHAPEGYEFPACSSCNRYTASKVEPLVAMLKRMYPDVDGFKKQQETQRIMRGVATTQPETLLAMRASARQRRRHAKALSGRVGKTIQPWEVTVLSVKDPIITSSMDDFARKLFLALHYKHTGRVLPESGGLSYAWFTNIQNIERGGIFPKNIEKLGLQEPVLRRNGRLLHNQFDYKFHVSEDASSAYFIPVTFGYSFAMCGYTDANAANLDEGIGGKILRPFGPVSESA